MRKIVLLLAAVIFLPILCVPVSASEVTAESKITEVTVYPNRALINRLATLKLNSGEFEVILPDIIPEVDEDSLRVTLDGSAQARLFGAKVKKEFLEEVPSERVKQLKAQLEQLEDQIKGAQNLKAALEEEKNYLDSIRLFSKDQIPKDLVTKMPPAKDLDDTLKFLDSRLKENFSAVLEADVKLRNLSKELDALRRELIQISGPGRKMKRSIAVELEVLKAGNLDLKVSYLVSGAFWQPLYDARADFQKQSVELVSYGIVKQSTGEDWQDVAISLSTAKPAIGGRMPEVNSWFLKPYVPPRVMAEGYSRGLGMGRMKAAARLESADYKSIEENKVEAPAPVYAEVEEKGIAILYKLPKRATIKADGSEQKLAISSQALKADFLYSTFPRLNPACYLNSRVTNAKDLQLLAGRVNVFLEGDFVGTSTIDNVGPGEEFDLYLGLDENVKVKRELVEQKVDDVWVANIPSPNRKTTFKYKTTIENYKAKNIKVVFYEAMPISEDERIKVKLEKPSLEPKDKDYKDKKGVWRWELSLEPGAKSEIFYNFSVEHPRDLVVEGL